MTMKRISAPLGRSRSLLAALLVLLLSAWASVAFADDGAQAFLEAQHQKVTALLHQPASPARDAQVGTLLDGMIDYGELARRTFGLPCPAAVPACTNHWAGLTDGQKAEIRQLRADHPGVVVLAHPECPPEVVADWEATYRT